MRELIYSAFVSIDGVVDSPGGGAGETHRSAGWTFKDIEFRPEAYELKGREMQEAGALMFGRTSYEAGIAGGRALLAGANRPDAAFCVTDLIACGFLDTARHEFGLLIPDEISVIGFDDIEQASWLSYRLTSFSPPVEELAAAVVDLATMSETAVERAASSRSLEAPLVWRDTVRRTA